MEQAHLVAPEREGLAPLDRRFAGVEVHARHSKKAEAVGDVQVGAFIQSEARECEKGIPRGFAEFYLSLRVGRHNLRQVGLTYILDGENGLSLCHHVYPGNVADAEEFLAQRDGHWYFQFDCDHAALERLLARRLGRTTLLTNRLDWSAEQVVAGYTGQQRIKQLFRGRKLVSLLSD